MDSSQSSDSPQSGVDQGRGVQQGGAYRGLFRKRFLLATAGLVIATVALWVGKLDGTNWVYALMVVFGGHNAEDIVSAMRK